MTNKEIISLLASIKSGNPFSEILLKKYTYSQILIQINKLIRSGSAIVENRSLKLTNSGESYLESLKTRPLKGLDDLPRHKIAKISIDDIFAMRRSILDDLEITRLRAIARRQR